MQGAGVMSVALAVSAAGTVVVVRLLRRRSKNRDEIVTGVLGLSVGALHMLIIAFALVSGRQTISDADSTASDEARRSFLDPGPAGYLRVAAYCAAPAMFMIVLAAVLVRTAARRPARTRPESAGA